MSENRNQEIRDLIKEEFVRQYAVKPLSKIKVSNLVEKCAISRGTFYFYYTDIYDLYFDCQKDAIEKMHQGMDKLSLSTVVGNQERHIQEYTKFLKNNFIANKEEMKIFIQGSETNLFMRAFFEDIVRDFGGIMEFSDELTEEERSFLVSFHAGGMMEVLRRWILEDCKTSPETIAKINSMVVFNGTFPKLRR